MPIGFVDRTVYRHLGEFTRPVTQGFAIEGSMSGIVIDYTFIILGKIIFLYLDKVL